MIDQIIKKANSPYPPDSGSGGGGGGGGGHMSDGQYTAEMMIPGPKVGLLIGKGGENIRNLQVSLIDWLRPCFVFYLRLGILLNMDGF